MNAAVQGDRVAILEVGTPAPVDKQRVAGEDALAQHIGKVAVRMAWGVQRREAQASDLKRFPRLNAHVHAGKPVDRRQRRFGFRPPF